MDTDSENRLRQQVYELEQKLNESNQRNFEFDLSNEDLKSKNDDLRTDLQTAAIMGESLIKEKRELKGFKQLYEKTSYELETSKETNHRLRLQLDNQIHIQQAVNEQSEEQIVKLARAKTETEIKFRRQKTVKQEEIDDLHETLAFERAKSSENLKIKGPTRNRSMLGDTQLSLSRKRKDSAHFSRGRETSHNSNNSDSEQQETENTQHKRYQRASTLNEEFLNVNRNNNQVVKRHQNLQKLIQMAGAIDGNSTIRQLEGERDKSMDYITKLENENKKLKNENQLLKRKNSDLKTEISTYELMNGYREQVEKEERRDKEQRMNNSARSLEDEINSVSNNPSEAKILKNAIIQSQDVINTCISQTDEIQDQLHSVQCIVHEILEKNNLKLKPKQKSPIDHPDTDSQSEDDESCFNSPDNVSNSSTQNASDDLIASLLLLKDIAFKDNSCPDSNNPSNSLHYKAEITQLGETLTRLNNELTLNQEQLMNTIQQKVKMQIEIEEWQEDMACMVSQNVRLTSRLATSDTKLQHNQRTANQRRIRLSEWVRQKVHSMYT